MTKPNMYNIWIGCVDQTININIECNDAHTALCTLQSLDHEGSAVSGQINLENAEQLYRILEFLDAANIHP